MVIDRELFEYNNVNISITCQNPFFTLWLLLNLYFKHDLSITVVFML